MYKILVDGILIHSSKNEKLQVDNPEIEEQLNEIGKLEFSIYPNNNNFIYFTPNTTISFQKMKSIVEVYKDNELEFKGRLLENEDGFYVDKKIICESDLAFLVDSMLRPYAKKGTPKELFTYYVGVHNEQMKNEPNKQFIVGNVSDSIRDGDTSNTDNIITRSSEEVVSVWEEIKNKLINELGGYLIVDNVVEIDGNGKQTIKRRINWISEDDFPIIDQNIDYNKNLLDVKINVKGEEIKTALIIRGAKLETTIKDEATGVEIPQRLNIETIEDGKEYAQEDGDIIIKQGDYIYSKRAVEQYGFILGNANFDDVTSDVNQLIKNGIAKLNETKNAINTIEIKALDREKIDNVSPFKLGVKIRAFSKVHSLRGELFPITKIKKNLTNLASNSLTLTKTKNSFIEMSVKSIKSSNSIDEAISKISNEVVNSSNQITNIKNNYSSNENTNLLINGLQSQIDGLKGKVNTILWQGTKYLPQDDSIVLSNKISDQINGVVLIFQETTNNEYFCSYVPKSSVSLNSGAKSTFNFMANNFNVVGAKTLLIGDDYISGHANNTLAGTANGITFNNATFALRYVIGV